MYNLRIFLAVAVFCISSYLVLDLFSNGFSFTLLLAALFGFILAHFLLPKKRKKDDNDELDLIDLIQNIIDLPYKAMSYFFRKIGRFSKERDSNIDIDF
jgi:hypothetical protein